MKISELTHSVRNESENLVETLFYIELEKGGYLSATLTLPNEVKTDRYPAVLFCHGFTGTRIEPRGIFVHMSRDLAARGIGSLRFDYRGNGESSGRFRDYTLNDYVDDAAACLACLKNLDAIHNTRIGVLGYSLGGCVASMLVGTHPDDIRAICLWAPVADPEFIVERMFETHTERPLSYIPGAIPEYNDINGAEVSRGFIMSVLNANPLDAILATHEPVLICHGKNDETVEAWQVEKYAEILSTHQKYVEIYWLIGANHSFASVEHTKKLFAKTGEWFSEHLHSRLQQ